MLSGHSFGDTCWSAGPNRSLLDQLRRLNRALEWRLYGSRVDGNEVERVL